MREDQVFQLVSLVAILLFLASAALPLTPRLKALARGGAIGVVVVGIAAALALFVVG